MLKRWILHVEKHRGYRWHISIRPARRPGLVVWNGGERSVLEPCRECSPVGYFARALEPLPTPPPADEGPS